jgi:hypothetical protein
MRDGIRYLNYSGAAIEFIFYGTRAEAVLWSDSHLLEDIYKAWVAVFVDEEETPSLRFSLDKEEASYVLYQGNETKCIKIRLVKYSEAAFGKVGIKSITIDGDKPLLPTPKKERKLEFIGDSITCGYGNEGRWMVDAFNTAQENPWEAYAARSARAVDADYHLISWSGIGIISSWTDQDVPNEDLLMPELYSYTDKATERVLGNIEPEVWDNNRFIPDCIVINLGTNDSSYTKQKYERIKLFENKYYDFVKKVRTANPTSKILCTLGAMGQDLCNEIESQMDRLVCEGEVNIYYMPFDLQKTEDGIGSDWHPSLASHEKMAKKLEGKIREIMGWKLEA